MDIIGEKTIFKIFSMVCKVQLYWENTSMEIVWNRKVFWTTLIDSLKPSWHLLNIKFFMLRSWNYRRFFNARSSGMHKPQKWYHCAWIRFCFDSRCFSAFYLMNTSVNCYWGLTKRNIWFCNSIKLGLGFGFLESHVRMQLCKGEARPHSTEGVRLCFGPDSCGVRINGNSSCL